MHQTAERTEVLTVREAAERLRVAPVSVYKMVRVGRLRAVRIGAAIRIPADEIERFLHSK